MSASSIFSVFCKNPELIVFKFRIDDFGQLRFSEQFEIVTNLYKISPDFIVYFIIKLIDITELYG